MNAGD